MMDNLDIQHVNSAAILLFVLKEIWKSVKGKNHDHDLALTQNTLALVELREQMKYFVFQFNELSQRVKSLEEKQ